MACTRMPAWGPEAWPVVDSAFPFAEVAEACRHFEAGKHVGKVTVAVG